MNLVQCAGRRSSAAHGLLSCALKIDDVAFRYSDEVPDHLGGDRKREVPDQICRGVSARS